MTDKKKKNSSLELLAQALAAMELSGPPAAGQKFQTRWSTNDRIDPTDQPAVTGPSGGFA